MSKVIVITGASSGFGLMTAKLLAEAGHTVYAGMRGTTGKNAKQVADVAAYSKSKNVDLRSLELDISDSKSVEKAFQDAELAAKLDVLIHNAGHMVFGPTEAFSPEQIAELYDVNVVGTQRVNRVAIPLLRKRKQGLLVWVSSSSSRGGVPPYLGPYFAAKAGMDALAVSYAGELARWGIETSIIVPGAFTKGTNHFAHAGVPSDTKLVEAYDKGPYSDLREKVLKGLAGLEPADADPETVAKAIVEVVALPFGKRPYRVHVDPSHDGAEIGFAVTDRVREELLRRIGLDDLLRPRNLAG